MSNEAWRGKSYLAEKDYTGRSLLDIIELAQSLRQERADGLEEQRLIGKKIALVFEKASTRTRCAFEVAAFEQGASTTYLGPAGSHLGKEESVKDSARVLGRMYDAIAYRGFAQRTVEELSLYSQRPVFNALTDEWHPTQSLADVMTMMSHSTSSLSQISFVFVGDGRNNVARSLLITGAMLGMDVRICAPKELWPDAVTISLANDFAIESGARIKVDHDPKEALYNVEFVYSDVWLSMGESKELLGQRVELLSPYQVNSSLVEHTGRDDWKFMHCLPALHDETTLQGLELLERFGTTAFEVTDEIFESENSIVFDQAENRLHTIKALLVSTLS